MGRGKPQNHRGGSKVEHAAVLSSVRPIMTAAQNVTPVIAALLATTTAAAAGPCTAQISQAEQQIAELQSAPPLSGAREPNAPQSLGAQLHHQPTPGSITEALGTARADA